MLGRGEGGGGQGLLVSVDDGCEVDLSALDGPLQHRRDPIGVESAVRSTLLNVHQDAHSGGLAGSMMTASLVFSSVTR